MSNNFLFANNVSTTLSQSVSATATIINVASGDGAKFPSPGTGQTFALTLVDAATGLINEICYCTSRSADQLTVMRGQENTSSTTFSAGDTVAMYVTAGEMDLFPQAGLLKPFDYSFAQMIGGYAQNAITADPSIVGRFWVSTSNANTTTPGASGANWVPLFTNFVSKGGDTMNGPLTVSTHNGSDQEGQVRWGGNLQGNIAGYTYNSYYLYMSEVVNQYPFANLQVNGANNARTDFHFRQDTGRIESVLNAGSNNPLTNVSAFTSDLPLPVGMHVQIFQYTVPAGTQVNRLGNPIIVNLPQAFQTFSFATANDVGSGVFTAAVSPANGSQANLWFQSPQNQSGAIPGNVVFNIFAYGYYS